MCPFKLLFWKDIFENRSVIAVFEFPESRESLTGMHSLSFLSWCFSFFWWFWNQLRDVKKLLCYYYSESPFSVFFPFLPILFLSFAITTIFLPFPSFSFIIPLSNAASLMWTLQCLYHFYLSTTLYLLLPFSFYMRLNLGQVKHETMLASSLQ